MRDSTWIIPPEDLWRLVPMPDDLSLLDDPQIADFFKGME